MRRNHARAAETADSLAQLKTLFSNSSDTNALNLKALSRTRSHMLLLAILVVSAAVLTIILWSLVANAIGSIAVELSRGLEHSFHG